MMSFTTDMQAVAKDLLTQFGQKVVIRRRVDLYNPDTGEQTVANYDEETVGVKEAFRFHEINGTSVQVGDFKVTVYPTPGSVQMPQYKPGDRVLVDGREYRVVSSLPVNPQGPAIIYQFQVRA